MAHQSRTASRRSLLVASVAGLGSTVAVLGFASSGAVAYTSYEAVPATAEANKASYWGDECEKTDSGQGTTWIADADYGIVVLKSATTNHVYRGVEAGDELSSGFNGISHMITCPPETTTTTVTPTTVTPTTVTPTTVTPTTVADESLSPVPEQPSVDATPTDVGNFAPVLAEADALPTTGSATSTSAWLATAVLAVGTMLTVLGRRRPA